MYSFATILWAPIIIVHVLYSAIFNASTKNYLRNIIFGHQYLFINTSECFLCHVFFLHVFISLLCMVLFVIESTLISINKVYINIITAKTLIRLLYNLLTFNCNYCFTHVYKWLDCLFWKQVSLSHSHIVVYLLNQTSRICILTAQMRKIHMCCLEPDTVPALLWCSQFHVFLQ